MEDPDAWPFAFWEWLIGSVKSDHPDVLFLAVASARPKVMDRLARLGFTWVRRDLSEAAPPEQDAGRGLSDFWPDLWPDLWRSVVWVAPGGVDFSQRLVLAATQAASFGVSQIPDDARDLI